MCLTFYRIYQCGHCWQEHPIPCPGAEPRNRSWFSCFFPDPPPCRETQERKYAGGYCQACVEHSRMTTRAQAQLRRSRRKGRNGGGSSGRGSRRDRDKARRLLEDNAGRETHTHRVPLARIADPMGADRVYHTELAMAVDPRLPKLTTRSTLPSPIAASAVVSPLTQSEAAGPTFAVLEYDEYSENGSVERVSFGRSHY